MVDARAVVAVVSCFVSLTIHSHARAYTCDDFERDLRFDAANATEQARLIAQSVMENFPKQLAKNSYERLRAVATVNAYEASLSTYDQAKVSSALAGAAIIKGSEDAGGFSNYVSKFCRAGNNGQAILENIFASVILQEFQSLSVRSHGP